MIQSVLDVAGDIYEASEMISNPDECGFSHAYYHSVVLIQTNIYYLAGVNCQTDLVRLLLSGSVQEVETH